MASKRYDESFKEEVVNYVKKYNEEHGRGGQSAAAKKFAPITGLTIRAWLDKAGVETPGKGGRKRAKASSAAGAGKAKAAGKKAAAKKTSSARGGRSKKQQEAPSGSDLQDTLTRLVEVRNKIVELEAEYQELKELL